MPGGLMEAAQKTWLASARNVRVSALHRDVSRLLSEHGVLHTIEHLTDDHLFSVDIALAGMLFCCKLYVLFHCIPCLSSLRSCNSWRFCSPDMQMACQENSIFPKWVGQWTGD